MSGNMSGNGFSIIKSNAVSDVLDMPRVDARSFAFRSTWGRLGIPVSVGIVGFALVAVCVADMLGAFRADVFSSAWAVLCSMALVFGFDLSAVDFSWVLPFGVALVAVSGSAVLALKVSGVLSVPTRREVFRAVIRVLLSSDLTGILPERPRVGDFGLTARRNGRVWHVDSSCIDLGKFASVFADNSRIFGRDATVMRSDAGGIDVVFGSVEDAYRRAGGAL